MISGLFKKFTILASIACMLTACAQVDNTPSQGPKTTKVSSDQSSQTTASASKPSIKSLLSLNSSPDPSTPASSVNVSGGSNGDDSLWDHMRADFQLPQAADKAAVQQQIQWYASHQEYLNRVLNRAAPYMYYILEQTQQRNLPAELVLLPVMESAYNPFANSYRGAAGLWQLMSPTASGYGVKEDWWYDGRRDIYASTNAALDYLTYLQSYFGGNWLLAIAAYDTGEGNVQNAVRRNARSGLPTDFWSLQLAAETQSYVPRLLALAAIISNPGKYNVTLPNITDQPYLQQVNLGSAISLTQAAQLAGMSLSDLKQLNPAYSHMTTDPNGPYKLCLPIEKIAIFKENLSNAPTINRTTWGRYKVQSGDTLASIAKHFNTTVDEIKDANQLKGHRAPVGRVIMIPTGTENVKPHVIDDTDDNQTDLNNPPTIDSKKPTSLINEDTLDEQENNALNAISGDNSNSSSSSSDDTANTNTSDTQEVKSTPPTDNNTPAAPAAPASTGASKVEKYHVVKAGESLYTIAKKYKISVTELKHLNHLTKKNLKPGTKLVVGETEVANTNNVVTSAPAAADNPTEVTTTTNKHQSANTSTQKATSKTKVAKNIATKTTSKTGRHYTVKSGDTLSTIAKHLGVKESDLKKWNHLSGHALKPGQHLAIQ